MLAAELPEAWSLKRGAYVRFPVGSSLFSAAARLVRRVNGDGAHRDRLCHPRWASLFLPSVGPGSRRFITLIASATPSGKAALATMASFAGKVMTSSGSPYRHASMICEAARRASMDASGIESEMTNHVNSSRYRPLNHALKGEPVRIIPGQTVVT